MMSRRRVLNMNENDPWGQDDSVDGLQASSSGQSPIRNQIFTERDMQLLQINSFAVSSCEGQGVPSLHDMVIGCLALYLEEFLELGSDLGDFLLAEEKAALLAAARRKDILDDAALRTLAEEHCQHLDLSYSQITSAGLISVLPSLPHLRHISLLGLRVTRDLVFALSEHCSKLESLRVVALDSAEDKRFSSALLSRKPRVAAPEAVHDADDSWEERSDQVKDEPCFQSLKYLLWPDISLESHRALHSSFPKLVINPKPVRERWRGVNAHQHLDVNIPLDLDDSKLAAQLQWEELCPFIGMRLQPEAEEKPKRRYQLLPGELSIAEKFKLAFQEQNERKALKAEKNRKQAYRRFLRNNPTQRMIQLAESGVPLSRKK